MAKKKGPAELESVEVRVVLDGEMQPTRVYANYMDVNQSPYQFNLRFGDAAPIYDVDSARKSGEHRIPIVAEIAVPVKLISGIIQALDTHYKKYMERFGEDTNEKARKEQTDSGAPIQ